MHAEGAFVLQAEVECQHARARRRRDKLRGSFNFGWKLRLGMQRVQPLQPPPLAQTQVLCQQFACGRFKHHSFCNLQANSPKWTC